MYCLPGQYVEITPSQGRLLLKKGSLYRGSLVLRNTVLRTKGTKIILKTYFNQVRKGQRKDLSLGYWCQVELAIGLVPKLVG